MTGSPISAPMAAILAALRVHTGGPKKDVSLAVERLDESSVDALLHLGRRHRVMPLLAEAMLSEVADAVPPRLADALNHARSMQAATALQQLQIIDMLARAMTQSGIDWRVMKGLPLSKRAYGDALLKTGMDIDLLVDRSDLAATFPLLRQLGFSPLFPHQADDVALMRWHGQAKESVWGGHSVQIDLHHQLADRDDVLQARSGLPPCEEVDLGNQVRVNALRPDWLIAHLAVHGAASCWFRWKWLVDCAALIHRLGDEAPTYVDQAAGLTPRREFSLMLAMIDHWFAMATTEKVAAGLRTRTAQKICESYLVGRLSWDEPTELALGTVPIHFAQLLLAPSALMEGNRIVKRAQLNR